MAFLQFLLLEFVLAGCTYYLSNTDYPILALLLTILVIGSSFILRFTTVATRPRAAFLAVSFTAFTAAGPSMMDYISNTPELPELSRSLVSVVSNHLESFSSQYESSTLLAYLTLVGLGLALLVSQVRWLFWCWSYLAILVLSICMVPSGVQDIDKALYVWAISLTTSFSYGWASRSRFRSLILVLCISVLVGACINGYVTGYVRPQFNAIKTSLEYGACSYLPQQNGILTPFTTITKVPIASVDNWKTYVMWSVQQTPPQKFEEVPSTIMISSLLSCNERLWNEFSLSEFDGMSPSCYWKLAQDVYTFGRLVKDTHNVDSPFISAVLGIASVSWTHVSTLVLAGYHLLRPLVVKFLYTLSSTFDLAKTLLWRSLLNLQSNLPGLCHTMKIYCQSMVAIFPSLVGEVFILYAISALPEIFFFVMGKLKAACTHGYTKMRRWVSSAISWIVQATCGSFSKICTYGSSIRWQHWWTKFGEFCELLASKSRIWLVVSSLVSTGIAISYLGLSPAMCIISGGINVLLVIRNFISGDPVVKFRLLTKIEKLEDSCQLQKDNEAWFWEQVDSSQILDQERDMTIWSDINNKDQPCNKHLALCEALAVNKTAAQKSVLVERTKHVQRTARVKAYDTFWDGITPKLLRVGVPSSTLEDAEDIPDIRERVLFLFKNQRKETDKAEERVQEDKNLIWDSFASDLKWLHRGHGLELTLSQREDLKAAKALDFDSQVTKVAHFCLNTTVRMNEQHRDDVETIIRRDCEIADLKKQLKEATRGKKDLVDEVALYKEESSNNANAGAALFRKLKETEGPIEYLKSLPIRKFTAQELFLYNGYPCLPAEIRAKVDKQFGLPDGVDFHDRIRYAPIDGARAKQIAQQIIDKVIVDRGLPHLCDEARRHIDLPGFYYTTLETRRKLGAVGQFLYKLSDERGNDLTAFNYFWKCNGVVDQHLIDLVRKRYKTNHSQMLHKVTVEALGERADAGILMDILHDADDCDWDDSKAKDMTKRVQECVEHIFTSPVRLSDFD